MDRRVTLQTRSLAAANARGEKIASFATLATVWGEKRDLSGRELYAASQLHAEARVSFRIRHRDSLTTINRVVYDGLTYDVLHIAEIGKRDGLELLCKRVET
jgi:SPP1 family predicted phage head-tail adaptor